jgi:hypothetical protein
MKYRITVVHEMLVAYLAISFVRGGCIYSHHVQNTLKQIGTFPEHKARVHSIYPIRFYYVSTF